MTPIKYSPFHAFIQRLAASAPGSWFLARFLRRVDGFLFRLTRGRVTLTSLLAGVPVVLITTTGAHTGLPRTSPLLPVWDATMPGSFALIASNWGQHRLPAWYFNLRKEPRAVCRWDGQELMYTAHEATDAEYERFWGYATDTYFGYALYRARAGRRIPIMVLARISS